MSIRLLVSLCMLLVAVLWPAPAPADAAAQEFVTAIYRNYAGTNAKGMQLNSPRVRGMISPSLLKLIEEDEKQAARKDEPPTLDGDPFVDAQDWEIPSFDVEVTDKAPDRAEATVQFTNGGSASTVTLMLVRLNNAWRIDDFIGAAGSLREALARKK